MAHDAPAPAPQQPAHVLGTWIDEQLRDMQAGQVARFAELRAQLQSDAFEWDNASLARGVVVLLEEAQQLDFDGLRQRGGVLGFFRSGGGGRKEFIARFRQVMQAARAVKAQFAELSGSHRAHTSSARRLLVELEMEQQSLRRDVNQAVEWLAGMTQDIARRGEGSDPARLELMIKRGEFFATHLKRLHALQEMAAAIHLVGLNVLERRASLLDQMRMDLDGFEKIWERRVGNVAADVEKGVSSIPGWDKAFEAHGELVARLEGTQAACDALQVEEHNMGLHLANLRQELAALVD